MFWISFVAQFEELNQVERITVSTFDSLYEFLRCMFCHKQTQLIILLLQERPCENEAQNFLSTFICMWPSTLLMYNINARGNDSQSTKTIYCLSNLRPLKIKTTLTKIKYKKGIKSWREKEIHIYRYGWYEGKDRAKKVWQWVSII